MQDLTVFISYSWDSENHKDWVKRLADYLITSGGMDVILDQYDLVAGNNMLYFMETAIEKSDKVLIILTPEYKLKADNRVAGVGYEHSIISSNLYELQKHNQKFIPILKDGDSKKSSPAFIKSFAYHDMTNLNRFEADAFKLVNVLYEKPDFVKPLKGVKPDLSTIVDPILEQLKNLVVDIDVANKRKAYTNSNDASTQLGLELRELYQTIINKSSEYKSKLGLYTSSKYDDYRCILNMQGHGMTISYHFNHDRDFEKNELSLRYFSRALAMEPGHYYFPSEEPKLIKTTVFYPIINDNLQIVWTNKDAKLLSPDLVGYIFSTLLEQVKKQI